MPQRTRSRVNAMSVARLAAGRQERQAHHAKTTEQWRAIPADSCSGVTLGTDRHPLSPGSLDLNSPKFPSQQYPGASDRYVTSVTSLLRDRKIRESFTGADVTSVTWKNLMGVHDATEVLNARQPPDQNGQLRVKFWAR